MGCGCFPERKEEQLLQNVSKTCLTVPLSQIDTGCESETMIDHHHECDFKTCLCIDRMIAALKYYHNIDIIKHQSELNQFVQSRNILLVNDFIHLVSFHENDIEHIHKSLFEEHHISRCKLNQCVIAQRNQRDRNEEDANYDIDNDESSNIELTFWIDLLDNIHCHLLHIYDYGYCMHVTQTNNEGIDDNAQYMHQLKKYISPRRKALDHLFVNKRSKYKYNVIFASNKTNEPQNFNIGLKYYYWDYYKEKREFIQAKYSNLKEEMLNNNICHLDAIKYALMIRKAEKMMKTLYCKSLKAHFIKDRHYNIERGSNISFNNLLSVILYVNYDMLSHALYTTFVAQTANEATHVIKQRHAEYRNWSQHLRETVDYFGTNVSELSSCYVGCTYIIVPSLSIRLRAAISTSKRLIVAMRFVDNIKDGIMLELAHNAHGSNDMSGFQCHWLSNVSAECEVLFMGGKYTMRVEGIWSLKNNIDFKNYFHALYYFDLMLRGVQITEDEARSIEMNDYRLLDYLITKKWTERSPNYCNNNMDMKYMQDMFDLYCNEKETIVLDLLDIDRGYKMFGTLIISQWSKNLVSLNRICSLFKHVTEIAIYAVDEKYKMNLLNFLAEITKEHCDHLDKIQIRCKHKKNVSWIRADLNKDVEFKFHSKKWKTKFVLGKGTKFDDVLTLTKRNNVSIKRSTTD